MEKVNNLIEKYSSKFGESFPIYVLRGKTDQELINILEKCIKTNKPHRVELIKGAIY